MNFCILKTKKKNLEIAFGQSLSPIVPLSTFSSLGFSRFCLMGHTLSQQVTASRVF